MEEAKETMAKETCAMKCCEEERAAKFVLGGSLFEGLGGLLAIVLALLALVLFVPTSLGALATIIIGGAMLFNAGALTSRFPKILAEVGKGNWEALEIKSGLMAEFLGGMIACVLGVLSLLGIESMVLLAVAIIVLGFALLLDSGVLMRLNWLTVDRPGEADRDYFVERGCVKLAAAFQVLVGGGAVILGVLSLSGMYPAVLTMVALLGIGCSVAFSGTSLGWRMMSLVYH